jgi:hypothetical protein
MDDGMMDVGAKGFMDIGTFGGEKEAAIFALRKIFFDSFDSFLSFVSFLLRLFRLFSLLHLFQLLPLPALNL